MVGAVQASNPKEPRTMNTTQVARQAKLVPVFVSDPITAGDALFDGRRRRPVAAFTPEGKGVVCCSRTAKKHGWTVVARAFSRRDNRTI